jgi:DNA polymerase III sliding clamp (beta) subunit (PCNA family)
MTSKKPVTQTVTPTVTMKASQLRALVAPVIPLADQTAWNLPVLNAVSIEAHGDYLIATATDRYRLGVQRIKMAEAVPGFAALISIRALRSILSIFKATRKSDPMLSITSSEGVLSVASVGALDIGAGFLSSSMTWPLVDGQYPKVRSILADASVKESAGDLALNPSLLAAFAAAQVQGEAMVMRGTAGHAVFVQIGEDFVGAIMQMKNTDASALKLDADWTGFLAAETKTEVAA